MSQRIQKPLLFFTFNSFILYYVFTSCAVRANGIKTLEGKIIGGGIVSNITKFPHAVFLSMICGDISMICGSSVINQNILVTAAHCLQCEKDFSIFAKAGHEDLRQVTVIRSVFDYIVHSGFSKTTLMNDIALLYLSKRLPLGNNIKRVIIRRQFPKEVTTAYLAGWGITDEETRHRPFHLREVKVNLHEADDCRRLGRIRPGMMCAGTYQDSRDRPSHGDSGSALITTEYQQVGLLSFRRVPFVSMLVYTNVSYFYPWIKDTARKLYCSQNIIKKKVSSHTNKDSNIISVKSWKK